MLNLFIAPIQRVFFIHKFVNLVHFIHYFDSSLCAHTPTHRHNHLPIFIEYSLPLFTVHIFFSCSFLYACLLWDFIDLFFTFYRILCLSFVCTFDRKLSLIIFFFVIWLIVFILFYCHRFETVSGPVFMYCNNFTFFYYVPSSFLCYSVCELRTYFKRNGLHEKFNKVMKKLHAFWKKKKKVLFLWVSECDVST